MPISWHGSRYLLSQARSCQQICLHSTDMQAHCELHTYVTKLVDGNVSNFPIPYRPWRVSLSPLTTLTAPQPACLYFHISVLPHNIFHSYVRHLQITRALHSQSQPLEAEVQRNQEYYSSHTTVIQGDSLSRGPKLLSIKNYVIEIMTWKFIYTYRQRWKTAWNPPRYIGLVQWLAFACVPH